MQAYEGVCAAHQGVEGLMGFNQPRPRALDGQTQVAAAHLFGTVRLTAA